MKTVLAVVCLLAIGQALAGGTYRCKDDSLLEIGGRNSEGYAQASLRYEDDRSSDLAAIWFTSNPQSRTGSMLSDMGEGLGPIVLNKSGSIAYRGHDKVKCSLIRE